MKQRLALTFASLEIQEQGGLEVAQTLDPEALASLGAEAAFAGPVELRLDFSVGGKEILLQGSARGAFALECSRCLAEVRSAFEAALEQTYGIGAQQIDVSDEVRESLLLALPVKPLCRPDCRGLCPRCGMNLNEGPCRCRIQD